MKRKHVELRGTKDEEKEANRFKDDLSSIQQSTNLTSHGHKENSSHDQKDSVKEKCDVPVVVRGALTNWPSLNWGGGGLAQGAGRPGD